MGSPKWGVGDGVFPEIGELAETAALAASFSSQGQRVELIEFSAAVMARATRCRRRVVDIHWA